MINSLKESFKEISGLLSRCKTVAVSGHINPDGDAIGACLAMAQGLNSLGVKPLIFLSSFPDKYNFLSGREFLCSDNPSTCEVDAFISLDCGAKDRLSSAADLFDKTEFTINIDHHISNTGFAKYNFVAGDFSSTSELVYTLFEDIFPLTIEYGEAIYTGIIFDTGGFCHDCTSENTHLIAGKLISAGVSGSKIYRDTMLSHSLASARVLGMCINNMVILEDEGLAYTTISVDELKKCGGTNSDLDGVVEYLLNIDGISTSMLFSERQPEEVKVSFRSNNIAVSDIAQSLGGGGHKKAAGATLYMDMEKSVCSVLDNIRNYRGETF